MIVAVALAALIATDSLTRYEFVETHMGTIFRIVLYAPAPTAAKTAADAAFGRVAHLNTIFSDYDSTSETRRLTQRPLNTPIPVSKELLDLLARAHAISQETDGAFDVTIGPATQLWRRTRRTRTLPSPAELEHARAAIGYRRLSLDSTHRTVTLLAPNMQLDFGGIAKGAAADAALVELRRHNITRAMVAAGGDIAIGDAPPNSLGWVVSDRVLSNAGISTSGDQHQFIDIAGVRYSHIIDPRTALGVGHRRPVTVIARTATDSDALATAAYVLGENAPRFLRCQYGGTAISCLSVTHLSLRVN
jgi:thiamine biosynthesis lipoprotein